MRWVHYGLPHINKRSKVGTASSSPRAPRSRGCWHVTSACGAFTGARFGCVSVCAHEYTYLCDKRLQ